MSPVFLPPVERSRKNEQVILHALAATGQTELAKAMGVHESTVSRMKDGGIATYAAALAHLGLKIVPVGVECFDPEYVSALRTLANVGIRQHAPKLDVDDLQCVRGRLAKGANRALFFETADVGLHRLSSAESVRSSRRWL